MRILGVFLVAWLAGVVGAVAQVEVEVTLDQQQFLAGEALPVAVRIVNRSGQTLQLGADDEWLRIAVETRDRGVVNKLSDPPVRGEFTLESSQRGTRRVDIAPHFNLSRQTTYLVQATVKIAQWDRQFTSVPVAFDIISGARLWEREFGVPQSATNAAPEVRKYTLLEANYLKRGLKLYLRIADANDSRIFRVVAVGPMVSFSRPEPQIDNRSNVHILYQYGRTAYAYVVVNPEGDVLIRQTYDITTNRPRLQLDDSGKMTVVGGARRFADDDFPPREPASESKETAPPPAAPLTNEVKTAKP